MFRLLRLSAPLAAVCLLTAVASPVAAQPERPSSSPPPSPGAPPPPVTVPRPADLRAAPTNDRTAARAAVRNQCRAERARFCRGGGDEASCLRPRFSRLSPDCQSAVSALGQAAEEHTGGGVR